MRREVIEYTGVSETRIRAVPLGISPEFRQRSMREVKEKLTEFDLPVGQYGLCVSTLEPRKRISCLLTAWRELPVVLRDHHPLILVGGAGWCNDALMEQITSGQQEGWLRYLGYMPEVQLPYLYAGARIFAYPSKYEEIGRASCRERVCQ